MKLSLVFLVVVLSVVVVYNDACPRAKERTGRTSTTARPTTRSRPAKRKPKPIHRHRIFSFSLVTKKPAPKRTCEEPDLCKPISSTKGCGSDRYILGKYSCPGDTEMCCRLY